MLTFRVYVAGPLFGSGRSSENIHNALLVADCVRKARPTDGRCVWPFVPHLFHAWDQIFPHADENFWLDMDKQELRLSQLVLVIPGVSPGTRKEETWAKEFKIPVYKLPESWAQAPQFAVDIMLERFIHGDHGPG
jgi:hypothetical protein